jgi:hypothetical protein
MTSSSVPPIGEPPASPAADTTPAIGASTASGSSAAAPKAPAGAAGTSTAGRTTGRSRPDESTVVGFIDMTAAQWRRVTQLAHAHGQADKFRASAVSLEQDQRRARSVRLTLCFEQASFPHAAFTIDSSGAYKTVEP